jgi:cell wall-associated NlpC family hydrolase
MSVPPEQPQPGDVVLTRFAGWTGKLIRFGAALLDRPNVRNHCIVVTHRDLLGVLWGIEARADGVGDVDLSKRLASRWVTANVDQPKTPTQRAAVVDTVRLMRGTPYDWGAIVEDTAHALRIDRYWRATDFPQDGRLPYAVVCSALADYAYQRARLPSPGGNVGGRFTTPADWDQFITTRGWEAP